MNTFYKTACLILLTGGILHGHADASSLGHQLQAETSSTLTVICQETSLFETMQTSIKPAVMELLTPSSGGSSSSLIVICQDNTRAAVSTLSDVVEPVVQVVAQVQQIVAGESAIPPKSAFVAVDPAAVPEPSTVLLLGGGMLGLVALLRRRRHQ